jgi:hypothetical protein
VPDLYWKRCKLTINDLIARLAGYFNDPEMPVPTEAAIETIKEDALDELAEMVFKSAKAALLEKDFAPTLTSGVADLSSFTDMKIDGIKRVEHSDSGIGELSNAGSWSYFRSTKSDLFNWYLIEKNKIYCRKGNGTDVVDDGTLTVLAPFTPSLATLPVDLESDLIAMVADAYLKGSGKPMPAQALAPVSA